MTHAGVGADEPAGDRVAAPSPQQALLARAAREFELPIDAAREAAAVAHRIRTGEGAWAWDATVIDWQGNEVTLLHGGETQRIDRLVRRRDSGEWWVLDYKSAYRPEEQPGLVAADEPVSGCGAQGEPWGIGAGGVSDGGREGGGSGAGVAVQGRSSDATDRSSRGR